MSLITTRKGAAAPKVPLPSAPTQISTESILLRLRELSAQISSVKPLYAESDALILELLRRSFKGAALPDGTTALLIDNFVDKDGAPRNTAFRPAGVKRFEVDFTDTLTARKGARR